MLFITVRRPLEAAGMYQCQISLKKVGRVRRREGDFSPVVTYISIEINGKVAGS
jgi:hypothetical protein